MDILSQYDTFNRLLDQFDSPYKVVNYVANKARNVAKQCNYKILDSEAISWVLNGEDDVALDNIIRRCKRRYTGKYQIDDILNYIDDEQVCEAVKESITNSRRLHHLIYIYKDVSDEPRKSRVRILTNMLWYRFSEYS